MRHNVKRYYLSHVGAAFKAGDTWDLINHTEPEYVLDLILRTADSPGSTRNNSRDLPAGNQSKPEWGRAESETSENKRTEFGVLSVHTGFRPGRSQSIQKTVQNKPGTTQKSPEQLQDFSKGTEDKLKETQILPVDTEIQPEYTEIQPEYTEFNSGDTGDKSADTEIKPGDTEFLPGDTIFKPVDTVFKPGDIEFFPGDTEEQTVDIEIQPVEVENLLVDLRFSLKDIEIRLGCCENLSGKRREFSEITGEKSEGSQKNPKTSRKTSEYIE